MAATRLPPGPFSFPIVGAVFSLRLPLHQHFATISKKYGPMIHLKMGMAPMVVVNNYEMAMQVLKTHDLEFAGRPQDEVFKLLTHDSSDIFMTPVGENWRKLRRICSMHLFTNKMLNASARHRESEMMEALKVIYEQSGAEVNLRKIFNRLFSNSLCLTLFSETDLEVIHLVQALMSLTLNLNVGVLVPALDRFDLHGIYKRARELLPLLTKQLVNQLDKHQLEKERAGDKFVLRDFTDVLISVDEPELPNRSKIALLSDMVIAGLETTLATLEWTMAEMINHPEIMAKAQEEIDKVVGKTRLVQESDLPNLPYIEAIVKESLRLHPVAPLGAPHRNVKPVNLCGYTIPADCKVLVNIWAIGRDPARWSDPEQFQPERFLSSNIPVNGQCFDFIPFSSGRRVCAGYPLAMRSVSYFLASLLQAFQWSSGKSSDISMEESTTSLTMYMKSDLVAVASPRAEFL